MLRVLATGSVLTMVGALLAAPVPAETRKPAAFPAGHYVLTGAGEPAQGADVYEFTKTFRLKPGQYVLSGGPKPTDLIVIDDDLEVYQDGKKLFIDDDHVASTDTRGKMAASYQGKPIVLVLNPEKKVRIVGIDHFGSDAIVSALWLHRWDGARKKLTDGRREESAPNLPNTFFDESYTLGDGFEMPQTVSTDAAIDVPAKPATLLPRFKPAPAPGTPDAPKPPDADEFIRKAITDGLIEDGAPLALVSDMAKREDFLGKCSLCRPTRIALEEYGKRKVQPVAKEGKGLPEELVKQLKSDKVEVRQPALRDLVARYMDREFAKTDLSREQKTALQAGLDRVRKEGLTSLPGGQKFCPSCDGACRVALKP